MNENEPTRQEEITIFSDQFYGRFRLVPKKVIEREGATLSVIFNDVDKKKITSGNVEAFSVGCLNTGYNWQLYSGWRKAGTYVENVNDMPSEDATRKYLDLNLRSKRIHLTFEHSGVQTENSGSIENKRYFSRSKKKSLENLEVIRKTILSYN
jgi:hypothetical protein